jgi:hypothetical protein
MSMPGQGQVTQATVDRVGQKLQALYDGHPPDEQRVFLAIIAQAASEAEVTGYGKSSSTFMLNAKFARNHIILKVALPQPTPLQEFAGLPLIMPPISDPPGPRPRGAAARWGAVTRTAGGGRRTGSRSHSGDR